MAIECRRLEAVDDLASSALSRLSAYGSAPRLQLPPLDALLECVGCAIDRRLVPMFAH